MTAVTPRAVEVSCVVHGSWVFPEGSMAVAAFGLQHASCPGQAARFEAARARRERARRSPKVRA